VPFKGTLRLRIHVVGALQSSKLLHHLLSGLMPTSSPIVRQWTLLPCATFKCTPWFVKEKPLPEHFSMQDSHIKQICTSITQPMPKLCTYAYRSLCIVDWVIFYDCGWTAKTETTKPVAPKITNGFILAKWVQGYWKNPKIKAEMA
jgi:hypothetical protein